MAWDVARAGHLSPFDFETGGSTSISSSGDNNSFYEGRLPVHSSDSSFSTHVFTMDAQTGAYTFGYDTGKNKTQSN